MNAFYIVNQFAFSCFPSLSFLSYRVTYKGGGGGCTCMRFTVFSVTCEKLSEWGSFLFCFVFSFVLLGNWTKSNAKTRMLHSCS